MSMLLDSLFGFPRVPVQRAYNWDCIMPDVWGGGVLGVAVSKFCQSVNFGEYNIDDITELNIGAKNEFFAGRMNIQNPRIVFVAPAPDIVSNYFHTWKRLIIDENGYHHVSSEYKKNIYIILYGRSGIPTNMIKLVQCFPKTFPSWNLSYKTEDIVEYDIEFKVDRIETGLSAFGSFGKDARDAIGSSITKVKEFF